MALATLSIDIVAKLAGLEQGLDKANHLLDKQAAEVQRCNAQMQASAQRLGAVLGSALAGYSLVAFTRETINGIDALNDLRDATGASIENISGLEDLALRTGTSFETASTALIKFNKELSDAKPGSETAQIFKALGLSAEELRKIDPAEALTKTAVALAKFADDGNKARIVQALFGKSVGEVAPLLKDLADQGKLVATVTTEQAQAAEDFNKQLSAIQKNATDAARSLVSELLPAVLSLTNEFKAGLKAYGNFADALLDAGLNVDPFKDIGEQITATTKKLGDLEAEAERVRDGKGFNNFFSTDSQKAFRLDLLQQQIELLKRRRSFLSDLEFADGSFANEGPARGSSSKPSAPSLPDVAKFTATEPKLADAQRYLESLQKQLQATKSLGVEETVLADIESRRLKLAAGESAAPLLKVARQIDAARASADAAKKVQERIDALPESKIAALNVELQALLNARPAAGPGRTDDAIRVLREEIDALNPASKEAAENFDRLNALLANTSSAKIAAANADLDLLRKRLAETGNVAEYTEAVMARFGIPDEAMKSVDEFTLFAEQAGRNIQDALGSSVKSFLSGEYKSIGGLFKNLILDLTSQALSAQLGKALLGDFGKSGQIGGLLGKGFDFIGGLFSANGNAFDAQGRITAFANGGVFDAPTPFRYGAGQLGVLGEAGPEAVMPLRRGPGGKLGVVAQGGGGNNTVINNNISVGAGVTRGEVVSLLQTWGNNLKAEILASQRNGGAFAR